MTIKWLKCLHCGRLDQSCTRGGLVHIGTSVTMRCSDCGSDSGRALLCRDCCPTGHKTHEWTEAPAEYIGHLARGGQFRITGRTWNGSEYVTETLAFEVHIDDSLLWQQVIQSRKNKSKRSTDGALTLRFIGKES